MQSTPRGRLILSLVSLCSVGMLLVAPVARADGDDHGRKHGDRDDRPIVVQVHNDGDNDADDRAQIGKELAQRLINAVNNEVATLMNANFADDDSSMVDVQHVHVLSLSSLTSRLNSTDATSVTNAVTANEAALQTFLSSGTTNASAVDTALSQAGVAQASALAIVTLGDDRLLVLTV